jgi:Fe-S cluster assembly iron-binding protein IscA
MRSRTKEVLEQVGVTVFINSISKTFMFGTREDYFPRKLGLELGEFRCG